MGWPSKYPGQFFSHKTQIPDLKKTQCKGWLLGGKKVARICRLVQELRLFTQHFCSKNTTLHASFLFNQKTSRMLNLTILFIHDKFPVIKKHHPLIYLSWSERYEAEAFFENSTTKTLFTIHVTAWSFDKNNDRCISIPTVDGSEIRRSPPNMYETPVNNGFIYHIKWCRISSINSIIILWG